MLTVFKEWDKAEVAAAKPPRKEKGKMFKKDLFVSDKELQEVREKIYCPQLNDADYGIWGSMSVEQRIMMHRMIETIKHLRGNKND